MEDWGYSTPSLQGSNILRARNHLNMVAQGITWSRPLVCALLVGFGLVGLSFMPQGSSSLAGRSDASACERVPL
jgi:hypothetical protein